MENNQSKLSSPGPQKRAMASPGMEADQPPQKRSRVSRACDQCRAGREKCDGAQPDCHTCAVQRRQCSYNELPKKRGIQPNYIRTLELTLAWLFYTFPDVESQLAVLLSDSSADVPKLITGKDAGRTETLHRTWRNGVVSRQIDQTLSGTPVEAFHRTSATSATKDILDRAHELDTPNGDTRDHPRIDTGTMIRLPPDTWTLIEYYFAFTHTWLPIVEKVSVLKVVYSYPPEGILKESATTAEHVELWGIMALAASQLAYAGRRDAGTVIRDTAQSLLPSEYNMIGLGHIKALLLLALLDITDEKWLPAWLLVGSAVRLLLSNGLGGFAAAERFNHVCLAAFVLESAIANELHAPTHMRVGDIGTLGFISEEGLEEWSPWLNPLNNSTATYGKAPARSCSTFNNVIRLTIYKLENGRKFSFQQTNIDSALNENNQAMENIVLVLTRNASHPVTSTQYLPSTVVATRIESMYGIGNQSMTASSPTFALPSQQRVLQGFPTKDSHSPYSKENDKTPGAGATPSYWLTGSTPDLPTSNSINSHIENSDAATDIFEELAMLERKDANQHPPQFMQNLGFAPDLDLADFFGADYLPSDPMLAYMQPGLSHGGSDDQRPGS